MNVSKTLYLRTLKTTAIKALFILNSCMSILCSLGIGLFAYSKMNRFFKLLFLQVFVWFVFYLLSYFIYFYKEGSNQKYNTLVFNIHMLIETSILLLAAQAYLKEKIQLAVFVFAYVVFGCVFVYQFSQDSIFFVYFNFVDLTESILMVLFFGTILYLELSSNTKHKFALLLSCIGLLVYFACSVPYIGMLNYLNEAYPKMNSFLFAVINDVLANVRYFSLAIAFWLISRQTLKPYPTHA